nr:beta-amyrin 28-oxidase-like [Tanacetum cinerariifolium]
EEAKWLRKMMFAYLGPDALSNRYTGTMEVVTRRHIQNQWQGRSELKVFETVRPYLFELACRLFLSLDDPKHVAELGTLFNTFLKGLGELPINIPGTRFYRAKRAANAIKKQLIVIIKQRRQALKQDQSSSFEDLLSHLLVSSDENGRFLSEAEIANNILLLLFAGHDTSAVSITLLMKSLAEHPD